MTEVALVQTPAKRNQLAWLRGLFFSPRSTFAGVNAAGERSWLVPMLVLSATALVYVLARGWVGAHLAAMGETPLPADWQYWTPEMQNQYMQAQQATQGPVFLYVIPGLGALTALWLLWVLVGSLLRLTLTLLGGHNSAAAMNVAAWAGLPFALRDLLRTAYVLINQHTITSAGLSGFVTAPGGGGVLFAQKLLIFADIFTLWYIVLLVIGVRAGNSISLGRAVAAVLIVVLIVFAARAGLALLSSRAGGLMITRPFF
jgi:Yip1-like protein